jgi:hypothetical protein
VLLAGGHNLFFGLAITLLSNPFNSYADSGFQIYGAAQPKRLHTKRKQVFIQNTFKALYLVHEPSKRLQPLVPDWLVQSI